MSLDVLFDLVREQLAATRPMPAQVVDAILDKYQQTEDTLPTFLADSVSSLDDMDQDLLLSPAYTPSFANRSACFQQMKDNTVSRAEQARLIQQLCDARVSTTFTLPNGTTAGLNVPEICIQRYVRLLHLENAIAPDVYAALQAQVPEENQAAFNTLAREMAWINRTSLLLAFLPVIGKLDIQRMRQLTDFVRTYRPKTLDELDRQLESYIRSCESDMARAGELSYHDERLKEKYVYLGEGSHVHPSEEQQRANFLQMMDQGRQLRELLHSVANTHAPAC